MSSSESQLAGLTIELMVGGSKLRSLGFRVLGSDGLRFKVRALGFRV